MRASPSRAGLSPAKLGSRTRGGFFRSAGLRDAPGRTLAGYPLERGHQLDFSCVPMSTGGGRPRSRPPFIHCIPRPLVALKLRGPQRCLRAWSRDATPTSRRPTHPAVSPVPRRTALALGDVFRWWNPYTSFSCSGKNRSSVEGHRGDRPEGRVRPDDPDTGNRRGRGHRRRWPSPRKALSIAHFAISFVYSLAPGCGECFDGRSDRPWSRSTGSIECQSARLADAPRPGRPAGTSAPTAVPGPCLPHGTG